MMGVCAAEGIGVIPWSPLARGRLARPWKSESTKRLETDKFGAGMYGKSEDSGKEVVDQLEKIAASRNVPMAQIALAWLLSKPGVTSPIVGATKPHHLDDAVAALDVKLTSQEIEALETPYVPHPTLGFS